MVYKKYIPYLFLAIIAGVAFFIYNPFPLYFQSDDFTHIAWSRESIFFQDNAFRPVCDASIMLDYFLFGKNAWGYHLTNLFLHVIASILGSLLSYIFCKKYFPVIIDKKLFACTCGILFFIYASHSEAVFWILGRSAILGAIFSFLFLWAYLQKYKARKFIIIYIVAFLLALLSYESSWVLPLFCVVGYFFEKEKSRWKHLAVVFSMFLLVFVVRYFFIHQVLGAYEGEDLLRGEWAVLATRFSLLVMRSFLPWYKENIIAFYGLGSLLVVWLFLFIILKNEKRKAILFILLFLISLLPYLSLGIDTNGVEGERFLYLPTFFSCFLLLLVLFAVQARKILKGCWFLLFCFFQLRVLHVNGANQQFAGMTVKQILAAIDQLPADQQILVEDLPQCQYGALIFRSGLPEALSWLVDERKAENISIISNRSEVLPLEVPYNTKNFSADSSGKVRLVFKEKALQVFK